MPQRAQAARGASVPRRLQGKQPPRKDDGSDEEFIEAYGMADEHKEWRHKDGRQAAGPVSEEFDWEREAEAERKAQMSPKELELERKAAYDSGAAAADGEDLEQAVLQRTDEVVECAIEGAIQDAVEDSERAALDEHLESTVHTRIARVRPGVGQRALGGEHRAKAEQRCEQLFVEPLAAAQGIPPPPLAGNEN